MFDSWLSKDVNQAFTMMNVHVIITHCSNLLNAWKLHVLNEEISIGVAQSLISRIYSVAKFEKVVGKTI